MTGAILVLGAGGAIGAHAAEACLRRGWRVRALVRSPAARARVTRLGCQTVEGDLRDPAALRRAFDGCDAFVHAAAWYPADPFRTRRAAAAAVASVQPVFEAARAAGARRGVLVSSAVTMPASEAISTPAAASPAAEPGGPAGIGRPPAVRRPGPYLAAKRAAEREAARAAATGLEVVVVNPTFCLGEHDPKPATRRLVLGVARRRIRATVAAPINVVHTGEVGEGIAAALERGRTGTCYLLAGENTSLPWLLRQIAFESGVPPPRLRLPLRLARAGALASDVAALAAGRAAYAGIGVEVLSLARHRDGSAARVALGLPEPLPVIETVRRTTRWFLETPGP
ncbi:MAG TPA: NAD-dependent epimerase/dehydratase family protein [Gemmatimonadota bacterium]